MSVFSSVRGLWERYVLYQRAKSSNKEIGGYIEKRSLPKEKEQAALAFYAPYHKCDPVSFHYYYEKTGDFSVNYLPEDLYFCYIEPHYNDWREGAYADNKVLYHKMYPMVKHPDSLAFRIKGLWYTEGHHPISRAELDGILARETEIVVKKAMGSQGGQGVFFIPGDQFATVEGKIRDDIIIQRPITQHPRFAAINPTSINTIRVMTMLRPEGVRLCSAILRFGMDGRRVDNKGYFCGIDWDGKMKKYAYRFAGFQCDRHPDTQVVFEGYELPGFQKAMELVKTLHLQTPRFRIISWDLAIDENCEPVLIEANLFNGGMRFHQVVNGPLFGEDTKMILDEVFGKK